MSFLHISKTFHYKNQYKNPLYHTKNDNNTNNTHADNEDGSEHIILPKVDYHRSSFNQLTTITLNHIKPTKLKPIIGKEIVGGILPINAANSPANAGNPFCIVIME